MTTFALTLLFLAAQTTILGLFILGLYPFAARRGSATIVALLTFSMAIFIALPLCALAPMPTIFDLTASPAHESFSLRPPAPSFNNSTQTLTKKDVATVDDDMSNPAQPAPAQTYEVLPHLWAALQSMSFQPEIEQSTWPRILAWATILIWSALLLRILIALYAVHALRRRSSPITDPELHTLFDNLKSQMSIHRPILLRETNALSTAATVGLFRPVILLPSCMAGWKACPTRGAGFPACQTDIPNEKATPEPQQAGKPAPQDVIRTILAHELAHIEQNHYTGRFLARICAALHFYHPLIHWFVARLTLNQELDADARAAQLVDSPDDYLKSLSQLALRQDDKTQSPTWTFLPANGTLIRRIKMLRKNGFQNEKRLPIGGRLAVAVLIGAMTLGVTMLRGPGVATADPPSQANKSSTPAFPQVQNPQGDAGVKNKPGNALEGFDFSYVPIDARGIVAFRPSALLEAEGLKDNLSLVDALVVDAHVLDAFFGITGSRDVSVNDIAQVTAELVIEKTDIPEHPETINVGRTFIRTKRPHDWESSVRKWFPRVEVSKHETGLLFTFPVKSYPLFGSVLCLLVPDDRTIIITNKDGLRGIPSAHKKIPHCLKATDLKDNREALLVLGMSLLPDEKKDSLGRFEGKTPFTLMALIAQNNYSLRFASMSMRKDKNGYDTIFKATCAGKNAARKFESDARVLVAMTKMTLAQEQGPTPASVDFLNGQLKPILDNLSIKREGIETNIALTIPLKFFASYVDMVKEATK